MAITLTKLPDGQTRYDISVRGRSTHGFRPSEKEAQEAAKADQGILYFAAGMDQVEDDVPEGKPQRRQRTESPKDDA